MSLTTDKPVQDYLGVGQSIEFNGKNYQLAWSSNPGEGYYNQEYLTDSSSLSNYNELLMVEAIKGSISTDDAVGVKVSELQEWKKSNPIINWNVYKNGEERVIDLWFLMVILSMNGIFTAIYHKKTRKRNICCFTLTAIKTVLLREKIYTCFLTVLSKIERSLLRSWALWNYHLLILLDSELTSRIN